MFAIIKNQRIRAPETAELKMEQQLFVHNNIGDCVRTLEWDNIGELDWEINYNMLRRVCVKC